jgi:beta-glucosidase
MGSQNPVYRNPNLSVEQRVSDLLNRMNLEEKVAQTLSIWKKESDLIIDEQGHFSPQKAEKVLKYGLGQISRGNQKKNPKESAVFLNTIQKFLIENTRLGIPVICHEEALHGHMALGATSFPQAIALASTWDPELIEKIFTAVAAEVRARGSHQVLSPVLDISRDPRWGRTEETYGEDPCLASRIGIACVKGFQGQGPHIDMQHVIATPKHFAVHGQPEGGMNCAPGNYSERIVKEVFLPPFKAAITEAGALSIMASYNEVDGIPSHANRKLLQDILRKEWGFQGFIVSDYHGISQLETIHHIAENPENAAKKALEAGVDLELPEIECYKTLIQQIKDGKISETLLDKSVSRIIRVKFLLGLFDNPYVDPDYAEKITNCPDHQSLALKAAHKAITLLKNEGNLLPLDKTKIKSLAVIGPNAAECHLGNYKGKSQYAVSILEGIINKVSRDIDVRYAPGCKIAISNDEKHDYGIVELSDPNEDKKTIKHAVEITQGCDIAVVVAGGNEFTCREGYKKTRKGDRTNIDPLGRQDDLIKAIIETGIPIIVFLINGRPLSINYIAENVPSILEGWYLGQETGNAVADVLFGDYNPGGKLPITFPRSVGHIPAFYNKKPSVEKGYLFTSDKPLFPFGHGLSYTIFKYNNLKVTPKKIDPGGKAVVSVDVTNSGSFVGDEVVQMYIRDVVSSVTRPVKELKDFKRITLKPDETQTVKFTISPDKLSFLDENMKETVESGLFEIMVGTNSSDLKMINLEVI